MAYGLNLYSDAGLLAFSSIYKGYRLLQKITVTGTTFINPSYYWLFSVTSTTGTPIVFVKPTGTRLGRAGAVSISLTSVSGSTYNYAVATQDTAGAGSSGNLYAYVFVPGSTTGSSYGINTFDASGVATFSTADRQLKISGYYISIQFNSNSGSPTGSSLSYGSVPSQYALAISTIGFQFRPNGTGGSFGFIVGGYVDNSNVLQYDIAANFTNIGTFISRYFVLGSIYVPIIDTTLYD